MKANSILLKTATGITLGVVLLISLIADNPSSLLFRSASASKTGHDDHSQTHKLGIASHGEGYVISQQQGQIACRRATPEEAQAMAQRDPDQRLRALRPATDDLRQQQTGLKIILRGTAQLDNFPAAKDAFIRAAARWEAIIQTPITVVIDVDYGPTGFGQPFGQNTIASTRTQLLGSDTIYPAVRTALITRASSAQEASLYNALPSATVPTDIGSTAAMSAPSALLRALGFINAVADPQAEQQQFGSPPAIGFNSAFSFDFDSGNGIGPNKIDFESTAIHEIGHFLGFTSNVGIKEIDPNEDPQLTVWDLFRFRPGVNLQTFGAAQRILSSGGSQNYFDGGGELALSTGRADGQGGDGNQASHWRADELSGQYIGLMDPSIGLGDHDPLTENDLRVLDVIGYQLRRSSTQLAQELKIDDGAIEGGFVQDGALMVNRLTPPRYPATLQSIRIMFAKFQNRPDPTGKPITLVYFTDANGAGQPPPGPQITRIQTTVPGTSSSSFFDFPVTGGPTINAGDFYVGFAAPAPSDGVGFPFDFNSTAQNRTFTSLDNGTQFSLVGPPTGNVSANAMIRANVGLSGASLPAIDVASTVDFGVVAANTTTRRPLTIRNTGVAILNITGLNGSAPFGVVASTGAFVVPPGGQETILVRFSAGSPGNQTGSITITSDDPARATVAVQAKGTIGGATLALSTVSAASFIGTALASEKIVAGFGGNLATQIAVASTLPLPISLAGTTVRVRDNAGFQRDAPLFFAAPGQVNFQIPAGTENGPATITIISGAGVVSSGAANIASVAPGLFTANANGQGVAAANALRVRANGSQVFEPISQFDAAQNRFVPVPIDLGPDGEQVFLILYGTGLRFRSNLSAVSVKIGGVDAEVSYAGSQGGFAGLDQINARIARSLIGRGEIDLVLTVDGRVANTVRVNIK
ncbi:MAG: NF038122 family metalloprotease [Blastocatellales bacterium]